MTLRIKPSDIYYSQSSIKCTFSNGRGLGFNLDEICEGRLEASNLPRIRVAKREEKWFTTDNRRLWLFRQLERLGKCGAIPVKEISSIPDEKITTTNDGVSVYIRGSPGGTWESKPDVPKAERRPGNFIQLETKHVRRRGRYNPYGRRR